jgi:hypothetical protein
MAERSAVTITADTGWPSRTSPSAPAMTSVSTARSPRQRAISRRSSSAQSASCSRSHAVTLSRRRPRAWRPSSASMSSTATVALTVLSALSSAPRRRSTSFVTGLRKVMGCGTPNDAGAISGPCSASASSTKCAARAGRQLRRDCGRTHRRPSRPLPWGLAYELQRVALPRGAVVMSGCGRVQEFCGSREPGRSGHGHFTRWRDPDSNRGTPRCSGGRRLPHFPLVPRATPVCLFVGPLGGLHRATL